MTLSSIRTTPTALSLTAQEQGSKVTRELSWLSFIGVDDHHIVVIYVIFFRHL